MFKVLIITFTGIALGYILRQVKALQYLQKTISWTIYLLLFFFGLQVGANEQVVSHLDTLGLRALLIAAAGSLGSCVAAWALHKFLFKGGSVLGYCGDNAIPGGDMETDVEQNTGQVQYVRKGQKNLTADEKECASADSNNLSGRKSALSEMVKYAAGFVTAGFFVLGCVCGVAGFVPQWLSGGEFSMYVLYALMIQVGMSIGSDQRLKEILASLNLKILLLPLGTIVGTLVAVSAAGLAINGLKLADCMAVGAGFGYYSLSSVLITQIKEPVVGAAVAAQIGTIALMSNIMREIITLLFSPAIGKLFGKLAPISVGGATSMDSTLPVITVACGKEMAFVSIFHGVLVDFSVPFLVTFFASL